MERTNLGPILDEAVARTRRRMTPRGLNADYDLAYEHFDVMHFLLQVRPLIDNNQVDPLRMFLRNGAAAKASPEINFSMQSYLARYPEKAQDTERSPYLEWLERGRAAGEIADPAPGLDHMAPVLGMTPLELSSTLADLRLDLQERLRHGTLGKMFARAAEVEPLVGDVWTETTRPTFPPMVSRNTALQVAVLHACQTAAGFARARLVLVASDPRWGGGRRMEGHIAHALTGPLAPEDIVVVYTDEGGSAPPGRFPSGVREVDLASALEGMDRPAALRTLVELIRSFHADTVVNINSRLFYESMGTYGKALAASERIFLMMFCNEQLAMGNWVGLPLRFFYRTFDLVDGVITDSDCLAGWLKERHQLTDEQSARVHVFRSPVDPTLPLAAPPSPAPDRRPQVFWAGRWDRQKRMDIALEVARLMPDVTFRMWGQEVLTGASLDDVSANVRLEGPYAHITDLELSEADVWLYTSGWDGVPSQLLEVGMTGIPIVGSLVGGTGEVLHHEDAWPVADVEDPHSYVQAIREVLSDTSEARRRSSALRERLLRERTEPAFADHVAAVLLGRDAAETDGHRMQVDQDEEVAR